MQEGGREREGGRATPAREEPPGSRSWQVASSVATALKPRFVQADLREIDMPSLLRRGNGLFIYLVRDFLFSFSFELEVVESLLPSLPFICIENFGMENYYLCDWSVSKVQRT